MATLTCSYCDRPCSSAEQAAGWCEYCKPRPMSPDQIAELAHSPEFRAMMAPHQKLRASLGKRPSPAIAVAMGQSVRLTDAEVDAIVHGGAAGAGEQPSITDRDPGDESWPGKAWEAMANEQSQSLDAAIARINELKAENAQIRAMAHGLSTEYVNACARTIAALEAENAKLRADLAKWSRSQTVPEGSFW